MRKFSEIRSRLPGNRHPRNFDVFRHFHLNLFVSRLLNTMFLIMWLITMVIRPSYGQHFYLRDNLIERVRDLVARVDQLIEKYDAWVEKPLVQTFTGRCPKSLGTSECLKVNRECYCTVLKNVNSRSN